MPEHACVMWCETLRPGTFEVWQTGHYNSSWQRGRNWKENNLETFLLDQGQLWSEPAKEMTCIIRHICTETSQKTSPCFLTSVFQIVRLMTGFYVCIKILLLLWNVNVSLIIFWSLTVNTSAFFPVSGGSFFFFLSFFAALFLYFFLSLSAETSLSWPCFHLSSGGWESSWMRRTKAWTCWWSIFLLHSMPSRKSLYQLFSLFATSVYM